MKKIYLMLILIVTLCSCSYFQVKDAIKEADRGNYVASLNSLLGVLREDSEDRRALDAFELIYPSAEKKYYDELDLSRRNDIVRYTKALLNLLRMQEAYYNLPEISKKSVAVVKPPVQERNSIKKELAQNFYDLGMRMKPVTYEEKLRTYGYFSQAKKYDLNGRKDIKSKYNSSRESALGRFYLNFTGERRYFVDSSKERVEKNLESYPLFSLGNSKNYNLRYDVNISNVNYLPPKTMSYSGIDSYIEKVIKKVMEKVVETKVVDGKTVQVEKWVPVEKVVEVEVFYRYVEYIKETSMSYDLSYTLKEKYGTVIKENKKKIAFKDRVNWVEYYPLNPILGFRPINFPVSEYEKYVLSREAMEEKVLQLGNDELDGVLKELDSNRIIDW